MNFANGTGGKFENGGGRRNNDRLLMAIMFPGRHGDLPMEHGQTLWSERNP